MQPPVEAEAETPPERIGRLFKNLYQSMRQALEESMRKEEVGLSLAHFMTVYALSVSPGAAGAELARRAFVTAQTMNTILRRLERDGFIERRPHPTNPRADSWYMTRSGRARFERARIVAEQVWSGVFESFKPGEIAQLERLLQRCLAGVERETARLRARSSAARSRPAVKGARGA